MILQLVAVGLLQCCSCPKFCAARSKFMCNTLRLKKISTPSCFRYHVFDPKPILIVFVALLPREYAIKW